MYVSVLQVYMPSNHSYTDNSSSLVMFRLVAHLTHIHKNTKGCLTSTPLPLMSLTHNNHHSIMQICNLYIIGKLHKSLLWVTAMKKQLWVDKDREFEDRSVTET